MNKAKLVKLAEEVLTNIDTDFEAEYRENLEKELCSQLSDMFIYARRHLVFGNENEDSHKKYYKSVKPILDDCIDKLLNKETNNSTYSNLVKQYRKNNLLSQQEFAIKCGISFRTVQNIEDGMPLSNQTKKKLNNMLNVNLK